jgi:hypothetical protein
MKLIDGSKEDNECDRIICKMHKKVAEKSISDRKIL